VGKYDPLGEYLRKQRLSRVPMTFREIERLIGAKLPNSRRYPAWWSNNPFNNVMTQVWLDAGYKTEEVDIEAEKLVFRKVESSPGIAQSEAISTAGKAEEVAHPILGWLKGTVRVAPGVDLTEPADPDWGKRAYGE
jgi:hypothetical protein